MVGPSGVRALTAMRRLCGFTFAALVCCPFTLSGLASVASLDILTAMMEGIGTEGVVSDWGLIIGTLIG